ncbi:uncharacterized protein LOC142339242 isoform X2 [Convolutriloba macropyga]|uniref:uncharacterized protein LOC142339242 isoform X2 n=1 Tax=Convolutriloba macropyga TaxID=536237 RepID=UPI003F51C6B6
MGSRENINYNNNLRNGGRLEERSAEGGGGGHWSEHIRQVGIQVNSNATRTTENDGAVGQLPICVSGGSSERQLLYVSSVDEPRCVNGEIHEGDLLLQVNEVRVAGFTARDAERLITQQATFLSPPTEVHLAIVGPECGLSVLLSELLANKSGLDGEGRGEEEISPEQQLQSDVRGNVHRYITPYTTKPPHGSLLGSNREGKEDGESGYEHVTERQFLQLEQRGFFIETGLYKGHYYGTPCPQNISLNDFLPLNTHKEFNPNFLSGTEQRAEEERRQETEDVEVGMSEGLLPAGWQRIEDMERGIVYYVDHINRRTQFEPPSPESNPLQPNYAPSALSNNFHSGSEVVNEEVVAEEAEEYSEWIWEDFETVLTKSSIGFGFTLQPIGPSYDINTQLQEGQSEEEGLYLQQLKRLGDALQITEIVEDGPAHNAYLQPGDVLFRVNNTRAVNADNRLIAGIFQSLREGDSVRVVVKRFTANTNQVESEEEEIEYSTTPSANRAIPPYNTNHINHGQVTTDASTVPVSSVDKTEASVDNSSGHSSFISNSFDKTTLSSKATTVIDTTTNNNINMYSQHQRHPMDFYTPHNAIGRPQSGGVNWNRHSGIESSSNARTANHSATIYASSNNSSSHNSSSGTNSVSNNQIATTNTSLSQLPLSHTANNNNKHMSNSSRPYQSHRFSTGPDHLHAMVNNNVSNSSRHRNSSQGLVVSNESNRLSRGGGAEMDPRESSGVGEMDYIQDHIYASLIHDQSSTSVLNNSSRQKLNSYDSSRDRRSDYSPLGEKREELQRRDENSTVTNTTSELQSKSQYISGQILHGYMSRNSDNYSNTNSSSIDQLPLNSNGNLSSQEMLFINSAAYNNSNNNKQRESNTLTRRASKGTTTAPELHHSYSNNSIDGQLVPVTLMKGSLGFGFTLAAIAVNGYQVQVKDILDRHKCQQLQSGDVIASVNGKASVNVTKEQVVAMLKGCPENQLAFLTVLRGVQIANDRQLKQSLSNSSQNNTENCTTGALTPPNSSRYREGEGTEMFYVKLKSRLDEFGFEIRGGSEENSLIYIGSILSNTAAFDCGQLKSGDEVMEIDGESVLNGKHSRAVALLQRAKGRGQVVLKLRRHPLTLYDLTVTKGAGESFGFVIVTSSNKQYTKIGAILPNSPAERCRHLQVDDRVYGVNGVPIGGMEHPTIVNLIREGGNSVALTLAKEQSGTTVGEQSRQLSSSSSPEMRMLNALTNDFINSSLLLSNNNNSNQNSHKENWPALIDENSSNVNVPFSDSSILNTSSQKVVKNDMSNSVDPKLVREQALSSFKSPHKSRPDHLPSSLEELMSSLMPPSLSSQADEMGIESPSVGQILKCRLVRDERVGFGFSVKGGVDFGSPINIFKIAPGGPADRSQMVKIGDVVVEVNGLSTQSMAHSDFLQTVRNTRSQVQLLLSRATPAPTPTTPLATPSQPTTPVGNF